MITFDCHFYQFFTNNNHSTSVLDFGRKTLGNKLANISLSIPSVLPKNFPRAGNAPLSNEVETPFPPFSTDHEAFPGSQAGYSVSENVVLIKSDNAKLF